MGAALAHARDRPRPHQRHLGALAALRPGHPGRLLALTPALFASQRGVVGLGPQSPDSCLGRALDRPGGSGGDALPPAARPALPLALNRGRGARPYGLSLWTTTTSRLGRCRRREATDSPCTMRETPQRP